MKIILFAVLYKRILPNFYFFERSRIREGKLKTLWPNCALRFSTMSYFSLTCFWDHTFNVSRIEEWGQCHGDTKVWPFTVKGGRDLQIWTWLVKSTCHTKPEQCHPRKRRHKWREAEVLMVWTTMPPQPRLLSSNMPTLLQWWYWQLQFSRVHLKTLAEKVFTASF